MRKKICILMIILVIILAVFAVFRINKSTDSNLEKITVADATITSRSFLKM